MVLERWLADKTFGELQTKGSAMAPWFFHVKNTEKQWIEVSITVCSRD